MLKVTLHTCAPGDVSAFNVVGKLDIAYAKLEAFADYKAVLQVAGIGEAARVRIEQYPRWSASVWDLVARTVCKALHDSEQLSPLQARGVGPFVEDLTAVIEHWPDGLEVRRATIGTAHVRKGRRRNYKATFDDDLTGSVMSEFFTYSPEELNHWDLLARAWTWASGSGGQLTPRPRLVHALPVDAPSGPVVLIDTLPQPAQSGLRRWLTRTCKTTLQHESFQGECVTEGDFLQFLNKAV